VRLQQCCNFVSGGPIELRNLDNHGVSAIALGRCERVFDNRSLAVRFEDEPDMTNPRPITAMVLHGSHRVVVPHHWCAHHFAPVIRAQSEGRSIGKIGAMQTRRGIGPARCANVSPDAVRNGHTLSGEMRFISLAP